MGKKITSHVLLLLLLLTFIGCSLNVDKESENSEDMDLTFIGASTTGTLFVILNALSECVNMSYPDSNITIIPGSTVSNPKRISNNEADASLTHNVTAYAAMQAQLLSVKKRKTWQLLRPSIPVFFKSPQTKIRE